MRDVRMIFEKSGRAVFLSHLDLMHTLQRSFSRAGVRCVYSSGFNPHMQLTLPVPLPLGHEGKNELLVAKLEEDDFDPGLLPDRVNPFLPEGIKIKEAYGSERKLSEISFADYFVEADLSDAGIEELEQYLNSPEVVVVKKTKRGEGPANIRPDIYSARLAYDGLILRLTASGSANLNPIYVVKAVEMKLGKPVGPVFYSRLGLLDRDAQPFR